MSKLQWSRDADYTDICKTESGLLVGTIVYSYHGHRVEEHEYRATVYGGVEKCFDDAYDAKRWIEEHHRNTQREKTMTNNMFPATIEDEIPLASEMAEIQLKKTQEAARKAVQDIVTQLKSGSQKVVHENTEAPQVVEYLQKVFRDKGYEVTGANPCRNEPSSTIICVPKPVVFR